SALFIPHLMKQGEAAIVNISSGLGFIPLTIMPVYCATKAALHSFSWSLRHQLRKTKVKVFEVIPPTVDTALDGGAREQRRQEYRGIPPAEVAEATLYGLKKDEYEIAVGQAQGLRTGTRQEAEQIFQRMNGNW
ncbi:MAG TPA: SDR family NAD(P)-dependent oxidoreductase, partial [Anaerolineales bacterium]